jgi:hypothetical protein
VSLVFGALSAIETVSTTGAVFATTDGAEVTGAELAVPSCAIAVTVIWSPLSPAFSCPRSRLEEVAKAMSTPFRCHW